MIYHEKLRQERVIIFIGAVVVYDATDVDSFKKMNQWVTELRNYLPNEIPILIAGNKSDLYNQI